MLTEHYFMKYTSYKYRLTPFIKLLLMRQKSSYACNELSQDRYMLYYYPICKCAFIYKRIHSQEYAAWL